jgi:hypothetical protein
LALTETKLLEQTASILDVSLAILAAYQVMADAKVPITPAKLATRAVTGYTTARITGVQARRGSVAKTAP